MQIGLGMEETSKFFDAVVNGPENAPIFDIVRLKSKNITEEKILNILSFIHDRWVISNSNETIFNKKVSKEQLRQYAPIDLIGWNEVKSDLLFLKPVLESVGINLDEEKLSKVYHQRVESYMEREKINGIDDLTSLVKKGRIYYPILPGELEKKLFTYSETISSQMIKNWQMNDSETTNIFNSRQFNHDKEASL